MLSTLLRSTFSALLDWAIISQFQYDPLAAAKQVYVSADRNEAARRPSTESHFRYTLLTSFDKLDNAIRAGFTHWLLMCLIWLFKRQINFI